MKISFNLLKQFAGTSLTATEAGNLLTNTGLEVESIIEFESVKGGLNGLVVGAVQEVWPHPDADKLRLTEVNVGTGENLQIVCGAANVAAGQKVLVAMPGAVIYPVFGEPILIKQSKIRGQFSGGMLCAEDEVGLGTGHHGIMVLDSRARPGMPAAEYFNFKADSILEIGLTPNRTDAMSHFGVARDLAAAARIHSPGKMDAKAKLLDAAWPPQSNQPFAIRFEVLEPNRCHRYSGICLDHITVGPSPDWLAKTLLSLGLKPINNVVDVTNYVMHECGQPLHAFDADSIAGKYISIKTFPSGTPFTGLDGITRKLEATDLCIADETRPLCLAGVFGGAESGVSVLTTRVFLESARFEPTGVRKTARRHGLNTDASFRFERGSDPDMVPYALLRAASLLALVAGAQTCSTVSDWYPQPITPVRVPFSPERFFKLSGIHIDPDRIKEILDSLDIQVISEVQSSWQLLVPPYRADVTREADVCEEVLRIFGYDQVPVSSVMKSSLSFKDRPDTERLENKISDYLVANGHFEIMSNSLIRADFAQHTALKPGAAVVPVLNPLSSDLGVMRPHMLFGGLQAISLNISHRRANLQLFEWGRTYTKSDKGYQEDQTLALFLTGECEPESWRFTQRKVDIFDLKAIVDGLMAHCGTGCEQIISAEDWALEERMEFYFENQLLGIAGKVKERWLGAANIEQPVFYAELYQDALSAISDQRRVTFSEPVKFPEVRRDLSLNVPLGLEFSQLQKSILVAEPSLVKRVNLFDVYEGKGLESGKKSYAISIILRDDKATLTDERIKKAIGKIVNLLESEHEAILRS